ncbi:MAG TPA: cupredoxin family copper-binding protein [Candidatus Limnocylindrales bacterium]|nr:cupredoxin family copper-binding protein [Candidatus Limnocylindrales bacterium]HEU4920992.1 cupredoxin family copper-binding protein [Candidatus Limnocylindrales bacterium]
MVSRRRAPLPLIVGTAALLAVFGGATAVLAADHAVAISGFSFSPGSLTIAVGDTVTWTNSDAQAHTATADDGSWDTGSLGNGASGTITFSTAGTFAYVCSIHPQMTGTVTVQAAATGGGGGGGGAGATTPPTDTTTGAPAANAEAGSAGDSAVPVGLLLLAAAWLGGVAVARRRFAVAR